MREKETRLKEYIKMVGVSDSQIRLSTLIVSGNLVSRLLCQPLTDLLPGMILLVSVCFITMLLKVGNILPLTHWSILFLFLCLYALVMLGYSFLVSTLFNNANLAACVASLLYFMVLFAHSVLIANQHQLSPLTLGLCVSHCMMVLMCLLLLSRQSMRMLFVHLCMKCNSSSCCRPLIA